MECPAGLQRLLIKRDGKPTAIIGTVNGKRVR
jgi:hypothetical protein